MASPIYLHPVLYELSLRLLYNVHYNNRYREVSDLIPAGGTVCDICAGDAALYRYFLCKKNVEYTVFDFNTKFTGWLSKKNIHSINANVISDAIPESDYIVMMGSLCQFIPNERTILSKLVKATKKRLIVTEPIRNLSSSAFPIVRWLGRILSQTKESDHPHRFRYETLVPLLNEFDFSGFRFVAGERDLLAYKDA